MQNKTLTKGLSLCHVSVMSLSCPSVMENKNHWRRDATRWREDRSVRRNPKGAKNLALLRGDILALIPQEKFSSFNAAFDHYIGHRAQALHLFTQTAPLQCT